eukprot:4660038-Pleurochrysis_carterae.AAC.2
MVVPSLSAREAWASDMPGSLRPPRRAGSRAARRRPPRRRARGIRAVSGENSRLTNHAGVVGVVSSRGEGMCGVLRVYKKPVVRMRVRVYVRFANRAQQLLPVHCRALTLSQSSTATPGVATT